MLDPYNRAYYVDSMTNPANNNSNNKVSPLKARKTLPATHRSRKKISTYHADTLQPSTALKTPPPSPSNGPATPLSKSYEKRIPKIKIKSSRTLPENPSSHHQPHRHHHHHHHHHHRHHPRLDKNRRSSISLSSSSSSGTRTQPSKHHHHHHHAHQRLPSQMYPMTKRHRFDKNTLDTFCFHWPAMHCYVLVRILPRTIAILPIRTRLAFLYFCHAPRPHHPTAPPRHPHRIQSMFKSWKHTLAFNDDDDDDTNDANHDGDDDETVAVTLTDVLKDHRTGDMGWIHAPCRLATNDTTNLLTLRSQRTTLELKARCVSEKKRFINLFHWYRVKSRPRRRRRKPIITSNDLLRTLERQNLKLQQDVDRTVTEVEQWQSEVLALEADDAALEVKMDGLWAALERHKTEHPLEHSLATVREDLQAYMADTHRRIMQRQHGSFAWERSFERLYRFQAAAQGRSVWLSWLALLALAGLVLLIYRSPLDVNYN